jgi:hypothetical protein
MGRHVTCAVAWKCVPATVASCFAGRGARALPVTPTVSVNVLTAFRRAAFRIR